jgi:hypothetical protein
MKIYPILHVSLLELYYASTISRKILEPPTSLIEIVGE